VRAGGRRHRLVAAPPRGFARLTPPA
jgi:hypothetical protein